MTQKSQTALQKMQDIANRLISNTPQLAKMLDNDSALKPKKPSSPISKKKGAHVSYGKSEMTANDYHQKCKDLSQQLQLSQDKCTDLQQELKIIKERFVERQIQYRTIIEQLQDELRSKTALDGNDRNRMAQIGELHKEIIDNIGSIQNKTSKILIEQQSDIRRFFHKKINEIKEKFKEDKINKTEKDQEYQQKQKNMISQLEWVKNIAHKIDEENKTLMKKYSSLRSQFDIQEKDKDILLKELLMKKKENAVLKSQVEQYETLLNEVSKEMQETEKEEEINSSRKKELQHSASKVSKTSDQGKLYSTAVGHLQSVIDKGKMQIRKLKTLYMREIASKSELEIIIRKLVEDVRESVIATDKARTKKKNGELGADQREKLLQKILENQKILTLIYDKTFYSPPKFAAMEEMSQELAEILEDEEKEGFH